MNVKRKLMKGNEAIGEAAIRAGCRFYFGYPITPQTELLEYMAVNLPKHNGVFLQSESELAAISMVYGAAASGERAMTSSSSPGISLMQEGLSYLASAELPALIVNISRGGPGLGRITPAQSDYFQATKGGGHGDYRLIVLAPFSVQEMADLTFLSFELADKYKTPVMLLGDGIIGQMMESVELKEALKPEAIPAKPWATTGPLNRKRNLVLSAPFTDKELIALNERLTVKYKKIALEETRWEEYCTDDAEAIIVGFGIMGRFAKAAVNNLRKEGYRAGLIRPITLSPFPSKIIEQRSKQTQVILTVEMNEGQMIEDVRLAVKGQVPVEFFGGGGGKIITYLDIENKVKNLLNGGGHSEDSIQTGSKYNR